MYTLRVEDLTGTYFAEFQCEDANDAYNWLQLVGVTQEATHNLVSMARRRNGIKLIGRSSKRENAFVVHVVFEGAVA